MKTDHRNGNTGAVSAANSGIINSGVIHVGGPGNDQPGWVTALVILIAFCTLVLTAAGVWVAAMR